MDHDWSHGEIANPFELGPRNIETNGESLNNTQETLQSDEEGNTPQNIEHYESSEAKESE